MATEGWQKRARAGDWQLKDVEKKGEGKARNRIVMGGRMIRRLVCNKN
jgi:hypothetical protein